MGDAAFNGLSNDRDGEKKKKPKKKRSLFVRLLRTILLSLLVAFTVGFVIGTLLRREVDKPVRYIGAAPVQATQADVRS